MHTYVYYSLTAAWTIIQKIILVYRAYVAICLSKFRNHDSLTYCSTKYELTDGFRTSQNQCCSIFSCRN